jgi:hypothetical protein
MDEVCPVGSLGEWDTMLRMTRSKVYLETTIPSYATALPSRDLVRAGRAERKRDHA